MFHLSARSIQNSVLVAIFAILFSGIQPNFKNLTTDTLFRIAPALATYGENIQNDGEFTIITFQRSTILNLSPRKIRSLFYFMYGADKKLFYISGLSTRLSNAILAGLKYDVEFAKNLCGKCVMQKPLNKG